MVPHPEKTAIAKSRPEWGHSFVLISLCTNKWSLRSGSDISLRPPLLFFAILRRFYATDKCIQESNRSSEDAVTMNVIRETLNR